MAGKHGGVRKEKTMKRLPTRKAAKLEIQSWYWQWRPRYPTDDKGLFFAYLQNDHPELLKFRATESEKWQLVLAWINQVTLPNED